MVPIYTRYLPFKLSFFALIVGLVIFQPKETQAQDPEYSQFYAAPLHLNPAFAGTAGYARINLNFRDQWPSVPQTYLTYSIAYDQFFARARSGIGIIALGDDEGQGIQNTISLSGVYSFNIQFSEKFAMNLGVQGTWIQRRLDWDKLKFFDQIDPIYGFNDAGNNPNPTFETQPDNNTISFVDFSAGALFFSSKFFGGVAVKHLSTPQQSWYDDAESTLPIRITGHAGGVIEIGKGREKSKIAPSIMYTQQANFKQLNLGTYFDRNIFYGGFFFRHTFGNSDAVILVAGINKKVWGIGYSYDFTISPFAKETGGAHEISLQFKLGMNAVKDDKKRIKGTLKCPNILE